MPDLRFSNSGWSFAVSALAGSAISSWLYLQSPLIGAIWGIFVFGSIAVLVDFLHNLPFAKWNAVGWGVLAAAGYLSVVLESSYSSSSRSSMESLYYLMFGWAIALVVGGLFLGQVLPSWLSKAKSFTSRLPGNSDDQMASRALLFLVITAVSCGLMVGTVRMKEREENVGQCVNQMAYEAAKYDGSYVDPLGVEYKRIDDVAVVSSSASEPREWQLKGEATQTAVSRSYPIRCLVRRQSGAVDHFVQKFTEEGNWVPVNPQSR